MGRFNGRVNSLIKKTHGFVSYEDCCLIRDYFQARLVEEEKPEDFDERCRELESLREQLSGTHDPALVERYREVLRMGPAIWLTAVIPDAVRYCENYPDGIWLENFIAEAYKDYAKWGRDHFAERKNR